MATKADFTLEEWQTLRYAMVDTLTYLSVVQPGFIDMLREAGSVGLFIAEETKSGANQLTRDLALDVHDSRDRDLTANPANIETPTLERLAAAARLLTEKAPEDLGAFRTFILGIAETVAEAAGGVSPAEMHAIEKVRAALG